MNNSIYKKGLALVLTIAIIIMTALGIKLSGKEKEMFVDYSNVQDDKQNKQSSEELTLNIFVDIDGAVINPSVYELMEGSRVIDLINMAGGLKENAATQNLNKARKLIDGEKIYIYEVGEEHVLNSNDSKLININTASEDILRTLPGIGEVYAKRIIEYRNKNKFSSLEEIKNIEGIGNKTFEKIKDLITIN